jgi:hypothetical protein
MSEILATWEVEIGKMAVPGWPGQNCLWDLISMENKLGVVACTSHPSNGKKLKIGWWSKLAWDKARPCLQTIQSKKAWNCGSSGRVPVYRARNRVQTLVPPKKIFTF